MNAEFSRAEQIKKWTVLDRDFLQEEDEITPTLKVRRRAIVEKYADTIEAMYAEIAPAATGTMSVPRMPWWSVQKNEYVRPASMLFRPHTTVRLARVDQGAPEHRARAVRMVALSAPRHRLAEPAEPVGLGVVHHVVKRPSRSSLNETRPPGSTVTVGVA